MARSVAEKHFKVPAPLQITLKTTSQIADLKLKIENRQLEMFDTRSLSH